MKPYNDYMDNISVDSKLHEKILTRVNEPETKPKFKLHPMYALAATVCLIIGISAFFILSGNGSKEPDWILNSLIDESARYNPESTIESITTPQITESPFTATPEIPTDRPYLTIITIGPDGLLCNLMNPTDEEFEYGDEFKLYEKQGGEWVLLNENMAFENNLQVLLPNDSPKKEISGKPTSSLSSWYNEIGALPEGEYKFEKIVGGYVLTHEFSIKLPSAMYLPNSSYANVLELLIQNRFNYIEYARSEERNDHDLLSVIGNLILIGEEQIFVYQYATNEFMEQEAANNINKGGTAVGYYEISWASSPHFFKKDDIIIQYVGEDTKILDFLKDNFGKAFAGCGVVDIKCSGCN